MAELECMPLGSAVISKSSSSSPQTYAYNAMNIRNGRAGMPLGSAVISKSSSSSLQTYAYNAMNVRNGRAEMPVGPAVISKSSSSSPRTYAYNDMNIRNGRAGMPLGSAVISKSSSSSSSKGAYADNRVLQMGVQSMGYETPSSTSSYFSSSSCAYDDNSVDQLRGFGGDSKSSELIYRLRATDINDRDRPSKEIESATQYPDYVYEEMEYLENLDKVRKELPTEKTSKVDLKAEKIIAFDELKIGEKIGMGGFADVYIATWKNQRVAVKRLRVQRVHQAKKKQFEKEVHSIANLDHPNIVKFYGACVVTPNLALVMEFLADGSLYDNLYYSEEGQETTFKDETKNQFIRDSFSALKYVHSKNMVHRDIKSKNIMLYDGKTRCKLADFGLALKDDSETDTATTQSGFAGTIKYCPREVVEGNRLTIEELKLVDVYALALTSFELLTEKEPFDQCKNVHQIRKAIINGEILKTLAAEEDISTAEKGLLKLALSPSQYRPSASQFLTRFNKIIAEKK